MTVETRDYVVKKLQGDMLTPISIFSALQGGADSGRNGDGGSDCELDGRGLEA